MVIIVSHHEARYQLIATHLINFRFINRYSLNFRTSFKWRQKESTCILFFFPLFFSIRQPQFCVDLKSLNNFSKASSNKHFCQVFGKFGHAVKEAIMLRQNPCIILWKKLTPGRGQFSPNEHNFNNLCRDLQDNATWQVFQLWG